MSGEERKPRPLVVNMKIVSKKPTYIVGFVNNREFGFKADLGLWEYNMSLDPFKGMAELIEGSPDFFKVTNTYLDAELGYTQVENILGAIFQQVLKVLEDQDEKKEIKLKENVK